MEKKDSINNNFCFLLIKNLCNTITKAVTGDFIACWQFMKRETQRFVDKSLKLSENFKSTINTAFQSFFGYDDNLWKER